MTPDWTRPESRPLAGHAVFDDKGRLVARWSAHFDAADDTAAMALSEASLALTVLGLDPGIPHRVEASAQSPLDQKIALPERRCAPSRRPLLMATSKEADEAAAAAFRLTAMRAILPAEGEPHLNHAFDRMGAEVPMIEAYPDAIAPTVAGPVATMAMPEALRRWTTAMALTQWANGKTTPPAYAGIAMAPSATARAHQRIELARGAARDAATLAAFLAKVGLGHDAAFATRLADPSVCFGDFRTPIVPPSRPIPPRDRYGRWITSNQCEERA